ncbi:hypothetical protein FA15DRAFT_711089 [Coprinopsis marcescibilis]|uniref:Uncharacterized protein n=1 Tax=Coprinopsis marcescibilis TaxID=230819 RepID=A0A5C3KB66_COPMA|nr:hypothetical protein FA15DRAFT_711089 [Coprinopsis marcescibilis]
MLLYSYCLSADTAEGPIIEGPMIPSSSNQIVERAMNTSNSGRLFASNGVTYYSPNCQQEITVIPPPSQDDFVDRNPFQPSLTYPDFWPPRWWSAAYGWTSFIPLYPNYSNPPFDCLTNPNIHRAMMAPYTKEAWAKLKDFMTRMASHLCNCFEILAIKPYPPPPPTGMGFRRQYRTASDAYEAVTNSRGWFAVWQGLLSFCVAQAHREYDLRVEYCQYNRVSIISYPTWAEFLAEKGYEQHWLDGIMAFSICNWSGSMERAGIFVQIPPIDNFCAFISHSPSPPTQLCLVSPAPFTPSATFLSEPDAFRSPRFTGAERREYSALQGEIMRQFIEEHEQYISHMMETADKRQKQWWTDRRRNPPTRKCQVMLWVEDPNNLGTLIKQKADDRDDLWSYTDNQKWYDPINEIWHCCYNLAPEDQVEEYPFDPEAINPNNLVLIGISSEPSSTNRTHVIALNSPPPTLDSGKANIEATPNEFLPPTDYNKQKLGDDILKILKEHYSFIPPLPLPTSKADAPMAKEQKIWILCILGFHPLMSHSAPFFSTSLCTIVFSFLASLSSQDKSKTPPTDQWDLDDRDGRAVQSGRRFKCLTIVNSQPSNPPFYIFRREGSKQWRLAVRSAADALLVCRLGHVAMHDLVVELAKRGVRFQTLLLMTLSPPAPCDFCVPLQFLPIWQHGYVFTQKDYDVYEESRNTLLAKGRMRTALMRGGYLWKLALHSLSPWDVIDRPSGSPGLTVLAGPETLVDNNLNTTELARICSAYGIVNNKHTVIKSW